MPVNDVPLAEAVARAVLVLVDAQREIVALVVDEPVDLSPIDRVVVGERADVGGAGRCGCGGRGDDSRQGREDYGGEHYGCCGPLTRCGIHSDRLGFLRECEARLSDSAGDVVQAPARRPWSERFPGVVDLTDKTTRLMTLLLIVGSLTWLAYTKQIPLTDFVQWLPQ
ncbi:hypothetical protein LO763_25585 [Glycomyces sp. A-F 0318]|uniref:hypothetical protein n=1 Tax=Glycomyces amatae TaxID=2881355 RepID=UPI001E5C5AE9|nr:hypothetical protein [Glycomyces amatae]MCD0446994.1 hypothetical protein [Glycomyces amatae]